MLTCFPGNKTGLIAHFSGWETSQLPAKTVDRLTRFSAKKNPFYPPPTFLDHENTQDGCDVFINNRLHTPLIVNKSKQKARRRQTLLTGP